MVACRCRPPQQPLVPTPEEPFRAKPPEIGAEAPFAAPSVDRRVLDNGVSVMVAPLPGRGVVSVCYVSRAAGIDDSHVVAGYVRLTTELMVTGHDVERLGATTGHSPDESRICVTSMPAELDAALVALADAVRRPAFEANAATLARDRWLARVDDTLDARREAQRWLLGEQRTLGMRSQAVRAVLGRFDLQRAEVTHARVYSPQASALVVAGDVPSETVTQRIAQLFGDWQADPPAPFPRPPPMAGAPPIQVVAHVEPRFQATLAVAFAAPARGAPDEAAFVVLERILGKMFSSRLNLAIREGEGHSYGAYAGYAPMEHDGLLTVTTAVEDGEAVRTVRLLLAEIERMQTTVPTADELVAAKATARQGARAELERTPSLAAALAELFVGGHGPERWSSFESPDRCGGRPRRHRGRPPLSRPPLPRRRDRVRRRRRGPRPIPPPGPARRRIPPTRVERRADGSAENVTNGSVLCRIGPIPF